MRPRRALVGALVALAALGIVACEPLPPTGTTTTTPGGTTTTTRPVSKDNRLTNGATLASGQALASPSGRFTIAMQADGNLVERTPAGRALWTSRTSGNTGAKLVMRSDGTLLIASTANKTLWSTPTSGVKSATVDLGDDGNFVLRGSVGQPYWANGASAATTARLPASQRFTSPQQVTLTKIYEGLVAVSPYLNANGNCTVGYGHLIRMGACTAADKAKKWDADALFAADVTEHENRLKSSLGTAPVDQREFDTLWDYVFGRGSITAKTSPSMYAAMSATPPKYAAVPGILEANGDTLIKGLCNRRYDEARIFEGGNYTRTSTC